MKKWLLASGAIIAAASYCYFSPKPAAALIKKAFEKGLATPPPAFSDWQQRVTVQRDLSYPSRYLQHTFDIFSPNSSARTPVILWVHGGAYVGGDKRDIDIYATSLAAHGYHVVSMNYALAPTAQYPAPLHQVAELYTYLQQHYAHLLDNIIIAGDSAGAQIAAQFIITQLDTSYAERIGIPQVIQPTQLRGAILCCGPYDLQQLDTLSDHPLLAELLQRAGWAYMGKRQWKQLPRTKLASVIDYIPATFPATFLTDGNAHTFTSHALALEKKFQTLQIPHTTVLYDEQEAQLFHEYQFMMDTPHAMQTFQALLSFLATIDKPSSHSL